MELIIVAAGSVLDTAVREIPAGNTKSSPRTGAVLPLQLAPLPQAPSELPSQVLVAAGAERVRALLRARRQARRVGARTRRRNDLIFSAIGFINKVQLSSQEAA